MRWMICFSMLTLTFVLAASPALAASKARAKAKKTSAKKAALVPRAPAAPVDHGSGALSSCKKHVENMLKNPATRFVSEAAISVRKADDVRFDVAGPVSSANAAGQPIGGNFSCRAELIGGAVWSTKTSLDFAR